MDTCWQWVGGSPFALVVEDSIFGEGIWEQKGGVGVSQRAGS